MTYWYGGYFEYSLGEAIECDELIFKAIWKELPKVNINFISMGGTGVMESVIVYLGDSYTLPVCTFTSPINKEFEGWLINGALYSPGDVINVGYPRVDVCAAWKDVISKNDGEEVTLRPDEEINLSSVTYKASSNAQYVSVTSSKNNKSVKIASTIKVNRKEYKVTELAKKSISGKKIKKVTIDATNLKKVHKNTFKGSKKLEKVTIKGTKKNSKIAKQIEKAARRVNKKVKIVYMK
ncbi:hypothetical protein [Butyrivibrio sp. WCE2006]|uniref:hypothetical protein n=1 Tax=Butyrivibrio sp. WCE2006 TaxID=1410611 RepID=UPI0005D14DE1|nr:hypothetical protein [Butyrivibrio sp. WCE2006]